MILRIVQLFFFCAEMFDDDFVYCATPRFMRRAQTCFDVIVCTRPEYTHREENVRYNTRSSACTHMLVFTITCEL